VAQEFQELLEYDFILKHIPGMTNTQADVLSRRTNNKGAKEDNNDVVVLPPLAFVKNTYTSLNDIDIQCRQEQFTHKDNIKPWVDHHSRDALCVKQIKSTHVDSQTPSHPNHYKQRSRTL